MEWIKLTRRELYERVWRTPMSRLAPEFGITDVALAKTCRKYDIPRPGRGYWARLAAGAKDQQPPLVEAESGADEMIFLRRVEGPVEPKAAAPKPPNVPVPRSLRKAHATTVELGLALENADEDEHGRLLVEGKGEPTFAVTTSAHRRALLLLDALAKGMEKRGHGVRLQTPSPPDEALHTVLAWSVADETIGLSIVEELDRVDHTPNEREKQALARGYGYGIPKYDHVPQGRLKLALLNARLHRNAWRDTQKRRLEKQLGRIVMAFEAEASRRKQARAEEERRRADEARQLHEAEERRRQAAEREARARHQQALVDDLEEMASRWGAVQRVRRFLAALGEAVPAGDRSADFGAWFAWASGWVDEVDPLCRPEQIPKPLEPVADRRDPVGSS